MRVPAEQTQVSVGPIRANPRVSVYAVVMLLVMYAVWEEPDDTFGLRAYITLVVATFLMLVAVALSHLLAELLDKQIRLGSKIDWSDLRRLVAINSQFLLTTIPVAIALLLPLALHWSGESGADELIALGLAALLFWGILAGARVGYGLIGRAGMGLAYLAVGGIVVLMKLVIGH